MTLFCPDIDGQKMANGAIYLKKQTKISLTNMALLKSQCVTRPPGKKYTGA